MKNYDCSCHVEYPNKAHLLKNGKWKCVDRYEKVEEWDPKYFLSCKTHCRRKDENGVERSEENKIQ